MLTTEQKVKCIDYLDELCNRTCFSRKSLGYMFRAYHVGTPVAMLIIIFLAPKWLALIAAICLFGVGVCFVIFNGCFLSMLERRLCNDDFTIADPFLEIFNWEVTNPNRNKVTYIIVCLYMLVFYSIYYYRFYYKNKNTKKDERAQDEVAQHEVEVVAQDEVEVAQHEVVATENIIKKDLNIRK
jgi:hypothetical protein